MNVEMFELWEHFHVIACDCFKAGVGHIQVINLGKVGVDVPRQIVTDLILNNQNLNVLVGFEWRVDATDISQSLVFTSNA